MFEHLDRLASRDGGEVVEELREGMPALQVIEQSLHGHARTAKHGKLRVFLPEFCDRVRQSPRRLTRRAAGT
jgi:hypothetical protein